MVTAIDDGFQYNSIKHNGIYIISPKINQSRYTTRCTTGLVKLVYVFTRLHTMPSEMIKKLKLQTNLANVQRRSTLFVFLN